MGGQVFGVSMMRDEADIAEGVIRHMAGEVDALVVADNRSTDGTRAILDRLAQELPLTVVDDPDPAHWQSRKMSFLAETAASLGAEWIVPFDADEIWFAENRISTVLRAADGSVDVVPAVLTNHYRTGADRDDPDPFRAMCWRDRSSLRLPKVAFRWRPGAVIHEGNHGVTLPGETRRRVGSLVLQVRHFPYRSAEHFTRKALQGAAALILTDLPEDVGGHWRSYARIYESMGVAGLEEVYGQHYFRLSPTDRDMVFDPAPYRRWEIA